MIKLTEKYFNSYYIIDVYPVKIIENITLNEHYDSNKTEQKNSHNQLPFDIEKMHKFSEKRERLYIEIETIKMFIKSNFLL